MVKRIYMDMVGDLFHVGHLNAINAAASLGDVIVGVVTDNFAATYKRRPIIPWIERATIIDSIRGVTHVMKQDNLTTSVLKNMNLCNATHFLHVDDWKIGKQLEIKKFL